MDFGAAPASLKSQFPKFKVPILNRTLTQWFNDILKTGFMIEQINEPYPGNKAVRRQPYLQDAKKQLIFYMFGVKKIMKMTVVNTCLVAYIAVIALVIYAEKVFAVRPVLKATVWQAGALKSGYFYSLKRRIIFSKNFLQIDLNLRYFFLVLYWLFLISIKLAVWGLHIK